VLGRAEIVLGKEDVIFSSRYAYLYAMNQQSFSDPRKKSVVPTHDRNAQIKQQRVQQVRTLHERRLKYPKPDNRQTND
jgi:hypothetical protein